MKKTYITSMPDHVGAFLKASKIIAEANMNITRVSYNKAIDMQTLFIEVEGEPAAHSIVNRRLQEIGYLQNNAAEQRVTLIELQLPDQPGSVTPVLELIHQFAFNISYMSSQENGTGFQSFKMGLFIDQPEKMAQFLQQVRKICSVKVLEYNPTERNYDNSIFYASFARELSKSMQLSKEAERSIAVHANLLMQTLDERSESPYKTFDYIRHFASQLAQYRKSAFRPRISEYFLTEQTTLTMIEPPCGSNTMILSCGNRALFIDSGYACYEPEMLSIFHRLFPAFDQMQKDVFVTHADVDHCGLLHCFDRIFASEKTAHCFALSASGKPDFREQNPLHAPYIRICKTLTSYHMPDLAKIHVLGGNLLPLQAPFLEIGTLDFCDLHFSVFEGAGGHLPGETILLDPVHKIAISGDIFVNHEGFSKPQATYNQYAPYLMTSVDTDAALCAMERKALFAMMPGKGWLLLGGHGAAKDFPS